MANHSRRSDYTVGYGSPPKATQFVPGKSGNPKGRPKGSRSLGSIVHEIMHQKIKVTEHGKTRRISALEVILRRLANDAMRGDQRAIKFSFALLASYGDADGGGQSFKTMQAEDRAILARYLADTADFSASNDIEAKGGDSIE